MELVIHLVQRKDLSVSSCIAASARHYALTSKGKFKRFIPDFMQTMKNGIRHSISAQLKNHE